MCEPIRFAECGQKCNEPYMTSNTPSCLIPELTSCSSRSSRSSSSSGYNNQKKPRRSCYDNDSVTCFKAMLINLKNVTADGQTNNVITVDIRKKNGMMMLQWQPFTATTAVDQAGYFSLGQGIRNMPNYPITGQYLIKVGQTWSWSTIVVDPSSANQIRFYYSHGMNETVNINTVIEIPGGSVQWITDS